MTENNPQIFPPSASAGGDNAHLHTCAHYSGGSRHYAVCLKIVADCERRKIREADADCMSAFESGECPALAMRANERRKNQALYYVPRAKVQQSSTAAFTPMVRTVAPPPPVTRAPGKTTDNIEPDREQGDLAQLVNKLMRDETGAT